jgi:hypothetical protein
MEKKSGSGMNIPDHFSESLEADFGFKIHKFFDADLDPGSGTMSFVNPASEIRDRKNRIRDKHPGSTILKCWNYFASENH